jgi:hypothetical protein
MLDRWAQRGSARDDYPYHLWDRTGHKDAYEVSKLAECLRTARDRISLFVTVGRWTSSYSDGQEGLGWKALRTRF